MANLIDCSYFLSLYRDVLSVGHIHEKIISTSLDHVAVQYGRGTLGIHIWELSGFEVQSALNVSL
jgi:hypothetical protein